MPVSNFPVINVIDVLNEIEDNEPFFMSIGCKNSSGDTIGHSMPAMRYIEPGTGIKKIRLGIQDRDSQEIVYKDLQSFKSDLKVVMDYLTGTDIQSIHRISIIQPL